MGKLTRNRLQNISIFLLSLSAIVLFAQIELSALSRGDLSEVPVLSQSETQSSSLADSSSPMRIVVTNDFGRSAQAYTTTSSASELVFLIGEAIGTATSVSPSSEETFRALLDGENVFFDFTVSLPLPILAALLGAESSASLSDFSARYLLLTTSGSTVQLIFRGDSVYSCTTSIPPNILSSLLDSYQGSTASFAYEMGEEYAFLDPYTLFTDQLPTYYILSASNALSDTDSLLRQLKFNPYTNSRYKDSDGTEVIIENDRTLRIQADGTILYQAEEGDTSFPVSSSGEVPTAVEAVSAAKALCESVIAPGDASLYLQSVAGSDGGYVLTFAYQWHGIPICFSDDQPAAELHIQDGAITSFTLRLRSYTATTSPSLLLPVRQAVAIAQQYTGVEMIVKYVDSGTGSVSAQWLAI